MNYYRLFDKQTGCYLNSCYNSKGKNELRENYMTYIHYDIEEEDVEYLNSLNNDEFIDNIKSNDFALEQSETPFKEVEY